MVYKNLLAKQEYMKTEASVPNVVINLIIISLKRIIYLYIVKSYENTLCRQQMCNF